MSRELIINTSIPEVRIAQLHDGEIHELFIERPSDRGIVGNIYKGKVTRVLPGMQAAFVDIGQDKAAFLYVDDVYDHSRALEEMEAPGTDEVVDIDDDVPAEGEEDSEALESQDGEALEAGAEEGSDEELGESLEDSPAETEISDDENPDEGSEEEPQMASEEGEEAEESVVEGGGDSENSSEEAQAASDSEGSEEKAASEERDSGNRRPRRGRDNRRGGGRKRSRSLPKEYYSEMAQGNALETDRWMLSAQEQGQDPVGTSEERSTEYHRVANFRGRKPEFKQRRGRDRQMRSRSQRSYRSKVGIQDLLKEGQEIIVQVAKEPMANKGARLTCHVSLAGRHLVCMPTIDHVGVSRRIDNDGERRKLRDFVERARKDKTGFIVRTASSGDSQEWIEKDMSYLTELWKEILQKAESAEAPALVYSDFNAVLRCIRDWVDEDFSKIVVDSRFYYNEITDFTSRFMPKLNDRVELYHGDIPIFDAYGISTDLHRALERKVWLKSGGYIVVDQAEALVAIDVNTGRFVGKRNLEDTILKTNLEAVEEIAYQLRLRNCGGIIIIDLIDMEREENKRRVYRALEEAIKKDRARPTIIKISELGLIEMTRKRTRDTVVRTMCESCSYCEGKGYLKSKATVAYEILRELEREGREKNARKILVRAHSQVIDILAIEHQDCLAQLERKYRKQIYLQAVLDYHVEQYEVHNDDNAQQKVAIVPVRNNNHRRPRRPRRPQRSSRSSRGSSETEAPKVASEQSNPENMGNSANLPSEPVEADGNQVSAQGSSRNADSDDSIGNRANTQGGNGSSPSMQAPSGNGQDDLDEEDRLAFLRAQAAQDAALANFGQDSSNSPSMNARANQGQNRRGRGRTGNGRNNHSGNRRGRGGRNYRGSRSGGSSRRGTRSSSQNSNRS